MKQRDFALLGEVKKPELVPDALIDRCKNFLQAVQLCIQYSHHSQTAVRDYLSMDAGNFSRMMAGSVNLPLNKIPALMMFCCNLVILQWLANEMGYGLVEKQVSQQDEAARLRLENEELKERLEAVA